MKTDCSKFGELLGAYADGELDADRAAQVEAHLATCAGCRRQIEILRDLDGLARQAGPPELHYDYWDWHRARVWRKLTRDTHERQRFYRPSFIWPKLAILAGSMAVVFVVVVLGWQALGPALFTQGEHASVDKLLVTSAPPRPTVPTDSERREPVADQISGGNFGKLTRTAGTGQSGSDGGSRVAQAEERRAVGAGGERALEQPAAVAALAARKAEPSDKDRVSAAGGKQKSVSPGEAVREMTDEEFRAMPVESLAGLVKGGTVLKIGGAKPKVADVQPVRLGLQSVPTTDDTGTAIVSLTTDTLGVVVDARVVRSSGKPKLDSIALTMARKSRFSPGMRDGKPARVSFELPYRFNKLAQNKRSK